ncbi:MAG: PD-(D/E)XK nuclease family protein [Oscillospiraceae bacterium]|nr:PD-(D/E)XK nuclease family protein [Oscillospiraceae bacterium]
MLHLILGGAGCGKSEYLIGRIQSAAEAGNPVRTLVPEPFTYSYDKRLYAALGAVGFNALKTGSFKMLTEEILSEIAAVPRDAADSVTKTVILHSLLRKLAKGNVLQFYGAQAEKPSFLPEMLSQLDELMQSGCEPEDLFQAASDTEQKNGILSAKLYDIARIYADYLTELEARGMRDALRDPVHAAAAADGSCFLRGAHIFLDEFESFTGDQYLMLDVMLRDAAEVWIALRSDDIDAPDFTRFDAVNQTARRLRRMAKSHHLETETVSLTEQYRFHAPSLAHLSRYIYALHQEPYAGVPAVTVCEARDMTLEAEYVAAQIRQLLMQGQLRAADIMVVMHDLSGYGSLLEAAFARYDIPYFMDLRRSVLHTAVMKLPVCLLSLMHRTDTEQIMLLLKTGLIPLESTEAAKLADFAYIWDIDGRAWEQPFAPEMDPEQEMEQLRAKIMQPIRKMHFASLPKDGQPVTGAQLCDALYACMEELEIPKAVVRTAKALHDCGDVSGGRAMRRLWKDMTDILDALYLALEHTELTPQELLDLLTTVLRNNQLPVPPQTLDAVTVQSAAAARYDSPKAVFVMGVNEGQFPADIQDSGFFSEQERAMLDACGVELSRSVRDLCADERLIVYKTLSAASEQLWLCYPLATEDGRHLIPSPLLEEVRSLLPLTAQPPHFVYAANMGAGFYVSTKAAAYYSFVEDYDISLTERASVRAMLESDPEEAARMERLRRRSDLSRLHVQEPLLLKKLGGEKLYMSATQIENKMMCPFMSFCKDNLKLYRPEKKDLSALNVGNMVHDCMERLFREHPDRDDFLAMTQDDLRAHARRCTDDFMTQQLGGRENRPKRFLQQFQRVTGRLYRLLRHTQDEMRQSQFTTDACELTIGRLGDETGTAPYTLTLENGMTLYLHGKIDRVDVTADAETGEQYLRIVDYKTGLHKKEFKLANVYYGLNLQMLLYLFALLDDPEVYPDAKPAGVLYMPASTPEAQDRENMKDTETYLREYFCMSGTVLHDMGILTKMEEALAGVYIPAKLDEKATESSGTLTLTKDSQVFTPEQLGRLRTYVEKLVAACAEAYLAGDVEPRPMQGGGNGYYADACAYCKYRSMCGLTADDTDRIRKPQRQDTVKKEMRGILDPAAAAAEAEKKQKGGRRA